MRTEWRGFKGNKWQSEVNLRDFIQNNYTSYDDSDFLFLYHVPFPYFLLMN